MLEIVIPDRNNLWDDAEQKLTTLTGSTIKLEHSLISLKKWEKIWHKPFLATEDKNYDEVISYIKCMTIDSNVDDRLYNFIPNGEFKRIIEYINDPMTAAWFNDHSNTSSMGKSEIVTSEIIYYWMIALNIPESYQEWHLNELLTLIKVVSIKNGPKEKLSKNEELMRRSALNEARKKKYKTKG